MCFLFVFTMLSFIFDRFWKTTWTHVVHFLNSCKTWKTTRWPKSRKKRSQLNVDKWSPPRAWGHVSCTCCGAGGQIKGFFLPPWAPSLAYIHNLGTHKASNFLQEYVFSEGTSGSGQKSVNTCETNILIFLKENVDFWKQKRIYWGPGKAKHRFSRRRM